MLHFNAGSIKVSLIFFHCFQDSKIQEEENETNNLF